MAQIIYHITEGNYFQQFSDTNPYVSPTFFDEKFIHLSTENQIDNTLQNYYLGNTGLILLFIDSELINEDLVYEKASNGELFPHNYGAIPLSAIVKIEKLKIPIKGIPFGFINLQDGI
jgi:uncharacterized protein (DUF952 family)